MISILIATKNRPSKLSNCLASISSNKYANYEILILDQSDDLKTKKIAHKFLKTRYFYFKEEGKSKALNKGILLAKGDILCFTDDDCLVDSNWLKIINDFFCSKENKEIIGFMGKTIANQEKDGCLCPATFDLGDKSIVYKFGQNHRYNDFGLGNNMGFRKQLFSEIEGFKEWLGVGTPTSSGEERELFFRILKKNFLLKYEPNILVYHDKLLNYRDFTLAQTSHTKGLTAFFTYYLFDDFFLMIKYIGQRIEDSIIEKIKKNIYRFIKHGYKSVIKIEIYCIFFEFYSILKGFLFGINYRGRGK